ncbi:cytochrome c [Phenylobacterium sp.]|uniref:SorB family sulfite dehydrogenase c-type cytochrome subunit n=1 Tax=Phenylobacterium sp. TaxID=1871053 RepID=UPI00356A5287
MSPLSRSLLVVIFLATSWGAAAREPGSKAPPAYNPPPESSRFIAAPGVEAAQKHCLACHSADYVSTQPPHMPAAFWQNEVAKMRNAYGAHLSDDDAKAVTDYLVTTYTEPSAGRR